MPPDFPIFETLRRHQVPFVIVGGHAVILHGYKRTTEDTDVVWLRSPESEHRLAIALEELQAHYISNEKDSATGLERTVPVTLPFIQARHLMMLWTPAHGFLDLFDYVPGHPDADVEELFKTQEDFSGFPVVSRDWLERMKRAAGRTKDLADLENLPPVE